MRKVVYGGAASLDNILSPPDHSMDWLKWSAEAGQIMMESWENFDAVLMGRKTYEVAVQNNQSEGFAGVGCYVFSRSPETPVAEGVTLVTEDAEEFLRELKSREGKDICLMGGGNLARTFFEAGLIDEVGLNLHPILLGGGSPVFHEFSRRMELELFECRPLPHGCVFVRYRVVHPADS